MPKTYHLELSPAAKRDLKRLPRSIQKEIVFKHLPEIVKDPFSKTEPLLGTLKGERCLLPSDNTNYVNSLKIWTFPKN